MKKIGGLAADRATDETADETAAYTTGSFRNYKELQYDKLAGLLRGNLDMNRIYEIIGKPDMPDSSYTDK